MHVFIRWGYFGLMFALWSACGDGGGPPKLSSIEPRFAKVGETVTLRGEGFGDRATPAYVLFGSRRVTARFVSPAELEVQIPDLFGEPQVAVEVDGLRSGRLRFQVVEDVTGSWKLVRAGAAHSCAIDDADELWCWGKNDAMQVRADELTLREPIPLRPIEDTWSRVEPSTYLVLGSTCAVSLKGDTWCWGENGNGFFTPSAVVFEGPFMLSPVKPYQALGLGGTLGCGQLDDGGLACWGEQAGGGNAERPGGSTLLRSISWQSFDVAHSHACGITDDQSLFCWGAGDAGQLGVGTTESSRRPRQVAAAAVTEWTQVAGGGISRPDSDGGQVEQGFTCAVAGDGSLWCWGANESGQLGDGSTTRRLRPVQVGSGLDWVAVTAGNYHACGLKIDGSLWCWGRNRERQAGSSSGERITVPTLVDGGPWRQVSAGAAHTCGLREAGSLWCWGDNTYGQLGHSHAESSARPLEVDRRIRSTN